MSLGGPTGYAINPARDLGPRLAHALLPIKGKGGSDWAYAWVPVVGPPPRRPRRRPADPPTGRPLLNHRPRSPAAGSSNNPPSRQCTDAKGHPMTDKK